MAFVSLFVAWKTLNIRTGSSSVKNLHLLLKVKEFKFVSPGSHQAEWLPIPGAQRRVWAQQPGCGCNEAKAVGPSTGCAHTRWHDCRGGGGKGVTCQHVANKLHKCYHIGMYVFHSSPPNIVFCLLPDLGGEHTLQWLPCGHLTGVTEARWICFQERSAHINRSVKPGNTCHFNWNPAFSHFVLFK